MVSESKAVCVFIVLGGEVKNDISTEEESKHSERGFVKGKIQEKMITGLQQ